MVAKAVILIITLAAGVAYHLPLTVPLDDAFHYGEFFAAAITLIETPPYDGLPYTLHGLSDILPAWLLHRLGVPREFLLAYTLFAYQAMEILAVFFAALASLRFARLFGVHPVVMAPLAIFLSMSVGWRDLLLCLGLYVFALVVEASGNTSRRRGMLPLLFAAVIAFGLYWSYNRGVAGFAGLMTPLLLLTVFKRNQTPAIGSLFLFVGAFGLMLPGMTPSHYVENFLVLLETSSKWQYALTDWHMRWAMTIVLINGLALIMGLWFALRYKPGLEQIAVLLGLGILSIVYLKMGLGRIDYGHLVTALWVPLLLIALVTGTSATALPRPSLRLLGAVVVLGLAVMVLAAWHRLVFPILAILLLMALALTPIRCKALAVVPVIGLSLGGLALASTNATEALEQGGYDWIATLDSPSETQQMVSEGVFWAGRKIDELGATCVFELVNAGLIHVVSGLPACSQFTYLIYAGAEHEAQLIADLHRQSPSAIVYSADDWHYAIDGVTMAERYPTLNAEILSRYDEQACQFGFCVRF